MKAHSQGPRCLPWSLKASKNEWGCIILNGNIWGNLPWNLLVNRQVWSMGHISIRKCASDLSLAACVPGNSLGTCKTHTCGSADRGQGRGVPHTPTHGSLSSSPSMETTAFSPEGVPKGTQMLSCGVVRIRGLNLRNLGSIQLRSENGVNSPFFWEPAHREPQRTSTCALNPTQRWGTGLCNTLSLFGGKKKSVYWRNEWMCIWKVEKWLALSPSTTLRGRRCHHCHFIDDKPKDQEGKVLPRSYEGKPFLWTGLWQS